MIKKDLKALFIMIDNLAKIDLLNKVLKVEKAWNASPVLNSIRLKVSPAIFILKYRIGLINKRSLKLHLGCGDNHLSGYINVDWRKTGATDLVCDIKKLPLPDKSVDSIEIYHVIEHLAMSTLPEALEEWHRILMHGGKLIVECPDFDEVIKEYLQGNEKRLSNIFGLNRFPGDTHLYGYNFKRLKQQLEGAGFEDIKQKEPRDYHTTDEPCLRIECIKGQSY